MKYFYHGWPASVNINVPSAGSDQGDNLTERKRPRLPKNKKKPPPLRARPIWLVKRQADKSKTDPPAGARQTLPIRRSARISAKANSDQKQAPSEAKPAADNVTTAGKKHTAPVVSCNMHYFLTLNHR
jgi:hypothetical protein